MASIARIAVRRASNRAWSCVRHSNQICFTSCPAGLQFQETLLAEAETPRLLLIRAPRVLGIFGEPGTRGSRGSRAAAALANVNPSAA